MWPLAMLYAVWVYNRLPKLDGPSPEELWSKIKGHSSDLSRAHAFGCPVYILDPKLQDGKSIWNSKARQGIFVGFSPDHSTNVPLVLNPSTQHVSPQYHVIFDDEFSTIPALTSLVERDETFEKLFESSRERFVDYEDLTHLPDLELNDNGLPVEGSDLLEDQWLSPDEVARRNLHRNESRPTASIDDISVPEGAKDPKGVPSFRVVPEGANQPSSALPRPKRAAAEANWKDGPVTTRQGSRLKSALVNLLLLPQYAYNAIGNFQAPANVSNIRGPHNKHQTKRVSFSQIDEANLLASDWNSVETSVKNGFGSCYSAFIQPDLSDELEACTVTDLDPHLLKAKLEADPDMPTFRQAISSPQQEFWWDAMELEMETLEGDLNAWDLVFREDWMKNILPSTWAFKLKHFPDGLAKKYKARFCV
jgi:hypothetical protein